jgi:Orsellinic acid/F9775 biosynthesis cluster protein D
VSKFARTNILDSSGRRVIALRGEDNLLHCPFCAYAVSPLEAKSMNRHICPTTDTSTAPGAAASSSNRHRAPVPISESNLSQPDALAAIYMANLWKDEHLEKFSLAIDTEHRVLVCQWHQVVINGSIQAIKNHLNHHSHPTSGFQLTAPSISHALNRWRVQTEAPQQPTHAVVPVSGIEPPRDGYQCSDCSYAVSVPDAARKHTNPSGGHNMKHGQVQRVQRIYWKILPKEDWEIGRSVDLTLEDLALINTITDSLMNPQSVENETDDVCVPQLMYSDPRSILRSHQTRNAVPQGYGPLSCI